MKIVLPDLPYAYDALEPHISKKTLHHHHDKHHKAYVDKAADLVKGTRFADMAVEEIVVATANSEEHKTLFNQAAQVWNHTFYWNCMAPKGGGTPPADVKSAIEKDFGGFDKFREAFKQAGTGQFGSGYVWLVGEGGKLKVRGTPNAMNPTVDKQFVLLTSDVWEHTYYLDYQEGRAKYLDAFLDNLINWKFVAQNFERMSKAGDPLEAARLAA
jgi:Fe-Mn family superoxide dismutase